MKTAYILNSLTEPSSVIVDKSNKLWYNIYVVERASRSKNHYNGSVEPRALWLTFYLKHGIIDM